MVLVRELQLLVVVEEGRLSDESRQDWLRKVGNIMEGKKPAMLMRILSEKE